MNSLFSFEWSKLGNLEEGRKNLGPDMPVLVYRMLEYSLKHVMYREFGEEKTIELFRKAGYLAGLEFAHNSLALNADSGSFLAEFIQAMENLKVGIIRIEEADFHNGIFMITVYEDLDCSGLPVTDEVVCNYDEGFLSGVLEAYVKRPVVVREIDCWANGDRVCRFQGKYC